MKKLKTIKPVKKDAAVKNYTLKEIFSVLGRYLKPYGFLLLLVFVFTAIKIAASLYAPIVIGDAVAAIAGAGAVDAPALLRCLWLLALCLVAEAIFQWLVTLFSNRISFSVVRDLRVDAFNKLNVIPLKTIDSNSHGDIMSRIVVDAELVCDGLILGFTQIFTAVLIIGGTIGFMLALEPFLALLVIVLTPFSLFLSWVTAKLSHNKIKEQAALRGEMAGFCEERITNQRTVKNFCYENDSLERFSQMNARIKKVGVKAMFFSSLSNPTSRIVNGIIYAAVAAAGAYLAVTKGFPVAALVSFLFYTNQYSKPFNEITSVVTEFQTAFASLRRLKDLLGEEEEKPADSTLPPLLKCDGTLEAKNVNFSYDESKPLIQDFNLSVKKGAKVAIVGPTGCGKTTLINLLMRFYDPQSGKIVLSHKDISTVSRSSVRSHYGMVLQDSWLFEGSFKENIAYGKPDASMDEIIEAAKKAHIHGFIMRQSHGYDTVVSQNGKNISQGQRQLLTLARIMLTSPPMLILDEATSNIDTRTEKRIQESFGEMMKGKTSFIIAHRLSTVMDADLILVMNKGNIIESGTHSRLLAAEGFYAILYNSQFKIWE